MTIERALFLSGSFGKGHDTLAEACLAALEPCGVKGEIVDSMALLGSGGGALGDWVFRRLLAIPPIYDGFHFSQLRGDGPVGRFADRAAIGTMMPRLRETYVRSRPQLVVSVFATGAGAAARLKAEHPDLRTAVFITDAFAHRMWVHEGTDVFLVTSALTAASVRRYWPAARVEVVTAPVRRPFYDAPEQAEARRALGVPADARCVLVISGAWGIGPLDEVAASLAGSGIWVLAVAGTNTRLLAKLERVARDERRVIPFGWTDRVPELMAACDAVVTSSGDTCREARALGRGLILLDVVPGHGRENVMHELELGDAAVCSPTAESVVGTVQAFLAERERPPTDGPAGHRVSAAQWEQAFVEALRTAGIDVPEAPNRLRSTV
jgi:processive 1,2-diacylglycerol beta-glucosyltransferase